MVGSTQGQPRLVRKIKGHKGSIQVTRYDSKGVYLLSGGFDRKIKLWNSTSQFQDSDPDSDPNSLDSPIQTYSIHSKEILSLDISHDNSKFVSSGSDTQIFLWEVATNQILRRFSGFFGKVNVSKFVGPDPSSAPGGVMEQNMIVQAGFDKSIRFFDLKSRDYKPIMELKESTDSVMDVVKNGDMLLSGGLDGIARTYDLRMGLLKEDLLDVPITSLSLTSTNTSMLITTLDSTHRLLDVSDGTLLQTFKGHSNQNFLCKSTFSKNEDLVLSGDEKGRIYAWDVLTGRETFIQAKEIGMKAHEKTTLWTEMNPINDNNFVTSGNDGLIKIWER